MQQRRLRLGDILDDYCPRERRVTNHAVVAMIDDEVKQTRCTTCDADHEYKQAKVPPQRRKRVAAEADAVEAAALRLRAGSDQALPPDEGEDVESVTESSPQFDPEPEPEHADAIPFASESSDPDPVAAAADDDGPVHRRLIRATLPRPEGQLPERKLPDFTIRHHGGRGREFNGKAHGHGRRPARGEAGAQSQPPRFGGPRHGGGGPRSASGQGPRPQGNRSARPEGQGGNRPGPRGRGRKRGR